MAESDGKTQNPSTQLTCTKCKGPLDRAGSYCKACHAAYTREYRKGNPLDPEQRKRDIARSIASVYKKRGKIKPQPCESCGNPKAQMHHPDYELPREVTWLCRECHGAWHRHWRVTALQTFQDWLAAAKKRAA